MKKLLKFVLIVVLFGGGGLYLYGRSLPREHTAGSTITLVAPVDSVYAAIRDIGGQAAWWNDVKGVTRLTARARESWEQDMGSWGKVQLEISAVSPPNRLVTTILNDDQQDWGGTWSYEIVASGSGTDVTIIEDGWVESPMFRVVARMMGHHRTMDSFLRSLAARFGETASPRHRD
jgi:uncharacterized protein YndB with AHSA1/START domain